MSDKKKCDSTSNMSRRKFLGSAVAAAATVTIVPRHVLGGPGYKAPSDKLNIACVGIGGKGFSDSVAMAGENVVALCDVDEKRASRKHKIGEEDGVEIKKNIFDYYPDARFYHDFRVMLDKEKSIDAITVSTPDHTHAIIAMAAIKAGKHVFVQKPLTHTVQEARLLNEAAKKAGVVTQMGNQGHAGEGVRLIFEWVRDGAIGDIREVHCWTNRPIWPQGIDAPTAIPSVPPTLKWDLWLGPASWRPYHPDYLPFSWRGWWDFGTGALGDMGAHILDPAYWPLDLKYPTSVQASSTKFTKDSPPLAEVVTYEFPERGKMPPLTLTWHDGGLKPPRPFDIEQGRRLGDSGGGTLLVGDKGKIMCGVYGKNARLIPETSMQAYKRPEKTILRSPGIHAEWIEACKKGDPAAATTNFSYSAPLTETMLLANVAVRMQDKNMKLEWDGEKGEITNLDEANEYLYMPYRDGWEL